MIMQTPKIDLYPHNQETYDRIIEMWQTSNRVAVIQATGTGKTYLMLRCMVDFEPSNKVVLAPSNYILDQLLSKANGNLPNTELLTYAKLAFMTKEEISLLNPSLIVLDEFHRCGADKWELGVDMLIKMFPNAKILGTSATPIRYLDNARDMSDELFEGNIAVNLSLSDAIVKGILPMPKYISALYTFDEEINNLQAKIEKSKNDDEAKKEYLKEVEVLKSKLNKSKGIPEILKKHITDVGGKFIVFCKNKQHLNEMESTVVEWFKKAKIGKAIEKYRVISSEIENAKELSAFGNNKNNENVRLLFSIDMLNEGIHIDDVTGVVLLRPTISTIIYYQQIGRSIQTGNTNNPLILDFVNNFNNIRVNTFISDLKESDEAEKFLRKFGGKEEVETPEFTVVDETKDIIDIFNFLENSILSDWELMYQKLIEYNAGNGSMDDSLANWIKTQRAVYGSGSLELDRQNKLNSIGFTWDIYDERWEGFYKDIIEYNKNYDTFNVPRDTIYNDKKLGNWVKVQRERYKKELLSVERINKLELIGFSWVDDRWNVFIINLLKYKIENGNCLVPSAYKINDYNLGKIVVHTRESYHKGKLEEFKITKLNELDFVWNAGRGTHMKSKEDKPNE